MLVRAFTVYVRTVLRYNSIIWAPYLKKDIEPIVKVQRRFTKCLHGLQNIPYHERLARLGPDLVLIT